MVTQADYSSQLIAFKRTETALELERKGYATSTEERIDGHQADLVARKGDKTLVYEFKVPGNGGAENLLQITDAAIQRGFEFHLVMVTPPRRPAIDVQNLAAILGGQISMRDPNELFLVVGGHMEVEVSDVDISEIEVNKEGIDISGRAAAAIDLEYGGEDEADRKRIFDFYPLTFALTLDRDLNVTSTRQLDLNTSSFHD